jgi:hypothetical protein
LHDEALRDGRRDEFLTALREIATRLRDNPIGFGEEVYNLPTLRLTVKVGIVLPVVVEFACYPDRRLVFVRTARYLRPG